MPHERRVSRAPALHARGGSQELPDPGDRKAPAIHPWRQSLYCSSKARHLTTGARRIFGRWILLACFACLPVHAQDTQFLPEIDAHLTFNSCVRGYLQAKDDREGGDPTQFTFGPSIEFYLKPLIKLKSVTAFDLDDAKSRPLVLESGYLLITAPNTPNENRLQEAATFRFPLFTQILLSDRNRVDLDWKNVSFTWRYRNKLALERTFAIRSYHFIPYVASLFARVSTTNGAPRIFMRVPYSR